MLPLLIKWETYGYPAFEPRPIDGTSLIYAKDVRRHMVFRSGCSLKIPLKGKLPYLIDHKRVEVLTGNFFLANHGREMECIPCQPGIEALFVNFSPSLLQDVLANHHLTGEELLELSGGNESPLHFFENTYRFSERLRPWVEWLATEMRNSPSARNDLSPSVFFSLATQLLEEQSQVKRQIEHLSAANLITRQEIYRRVLLAHDFMLDQWKESLGLEAVAHHACLSPYHFHRSFREVYGIAPMAFFKKFKLQKAKELLLTGKSTVTEIAMQIGFADLQSFSKAFKREWGVSPSGV